MFLDQCRAALAAAPVRALDDLAKKAMIAWGEGQLTDEALEEITAAITARRSAAKAAHEPARGVQRVASMFPPRARQRVSKSPERLERRRMLGTSSALPPQLRARFTMGEVAVLAIVLADVRQRGSCDASVAEIGARAGASYTLVRSAIRMAETLGLITVTERPRRGAKNLTNVVRVISAELRLWIARGPKSDRVQKYMPLRRVGLQVPKNHQTGKKDLLISLSTTDGTQLRRSS
jgi:hypothetical protein